MKRAHSPRVNTANLVVLGQTVGAKLCGDPPEKFDFSRPAFQGNLRSLEPTRIDWILMTYC